MFKKIFSLIVSICFFILTVQPVSASFNNSFVSIVNPVRGSDFWSLTDQKPSDAVTGQLEILRQNNLTSTFLVRFDVLQDPIVISELKNSPDEKGLFLEVTPSLTKAAGVNYHQSASWHNAASVLLTGYPPDDRKKLIDTAFEGFKSQFGSFPKSVGAWWIGADSLAYMQSKYGISNAMIVADQFSTDSYQIWGQYWGTPYYPAKNNSLFPAQSIDNKIPVIITQWADRDPVNGYGKGVGESTFSVQANDYLDYHNLDTNYFSKLIDIYTKPETQGNHFGQIVIGLENSYSWPKYKFEYQNQIRQLVNKQNAGQFKVVPLDSFASWYQSTFPGLSPSQLIYSKDPLGSSKITAWYMNNFYRVGFIANNEGAIIRDLRQYVSGQDELCLNQACNEVNFATFATRVLDQVTYGQKKVIDEGPVSDLQFLHQNDNVVLNYQNAAGKTEEIKFLPRDIDINTKPSTIDGFILDTTQQSQLTSKKLLFNNELSLKSSIPGQIINWLLFSLFICLAVIVPGEVIVKKNIPTIPNDTKLFLSIMVGLVELTIVGFISGLWLKNYYPVLIWIILNFGLFIYFKLYRIGNKLKINRQSLILSLLILLGAFFLIIPTFRNGLEYGYGLGFWGPNAHDGLWHLALINQLQNGVPAQNPVLGNTKLQNYHYFYDLLVAVVSFVTKISPVDLLFREFPLLFGLLLGTGTLSLLNFLSNKKNLLASVLCLYFVYMAGSFGWVVEILKHQGWNGESDFWTNQAISFNLNPPFMISLLLIISFLLLLFQYFRSSNRLLILPLILVAGTLLEFKAYGAILIGLSLLLAVFAQLLRKQYELIPILVGMTALTVLLLIPNYPSLSAIFQTGSGIFEWSPLWFIHTMIDSPDRLGLSRLSLTRLSGYESNNLLKIVYTEGIGILLFITGNLGLRLFGWGEFFKLRRWSDANYFLIFTMSILSFFIPMLLIQKGTPWNTIQFSYYGLFFFSILSSIFLAKLKLSRFVGLAAVLLVVILTPINCLAVALGYLYPQPHAFISTQELGGLQFLKQQPSGVVLTYPFNKYSKNSLQTPLPVLAYETSSYVSAFSNKPVYEADEIQQQILDLSAQPEYIKRIAAERDFFEGMETQKAMEFLYTNRIKYIYLPKIYPTQLDEGSLKLKRIFDNDQVAIYLVFGFD